MIKTFLVFMITNARGFRANETGWIVPLRLVATTNDNPVAVNDTISIE